MFQISIPPVRCKYESVKRLTSNLILYYLFVYLYTAFTDSLVKIVSVTLPNRGHNILIRIAVATSDVTRPLIFRRVWNFKQFRCFSSLLRLRFRRLFFALVLPFRFIQKISFLRNRGKHLSRNSRRGLIFYHYFRHFFPFSLFAWQMFAFFCRRSTGQNWLYEFQSCRNVISSTVF